MFAYAGLSQNLKDLTGFAPPVDFRYRLREPCNVRSKTCKADNCRGGRGLAETASTFFQKFKIGGGRAVCAIAECRERLLAASPVADLDFRKMYLPFPLVHALFYNFHRDTFSIGHRTAPADGCESEDSSRPWRMCDILPIPGTNETVCPNHSVQF